MNPISIALVEDNRVNRNAFLEKIKSFPELSVCFIAENGAICLEQLKTLPHKLLPQVIFMDIEMPVMNGIEAIAIGKILYPNIHFVVLTVFDDDDKLFEAIHSGASGYLLKHEPGEVLQQAIENVLVYGGAPMSPAIARKTLVMLGSSAAPANQERHGPPSQLTTKEAEVLKHLVKGWDAKRIATELHISLFTVRKHVANIYDKLHVSSKAQVIHLALAKKWFSN
jgi:DNA-binding NarL/FixJ family response regulator